MWQGLFLDTKGVFHQYYMVRDQSHYRLDICVRGTPFMVDPSGVEYSVYRKRKSTYEYGDTKVFQEYQRISDAIADAHGTTETTSQWSDGKYYTITIIKNDAKVFNSRSVKCNGELVEFEAHVGEQYIHYETSVQPATSLEPLNLIEYKEKVISTEDTAVYSTPYYPYDVLSRMYDLRHIEECDYVVATTEEIAEKRLEEWYQADVEHRGFDTETTGLDIWMYGEDHMVGIILSIGDTVSTYFPFRMKNIPNLSMEFLDKLMKKCIEKQDSLVAHNKKFDRMVMLKEGYDLRIGWCSMILSFMLNPVTEKGAHALKELIEKLFHLKYLELGQIFLSSANIDFSVLDEDITRIYACPDSPNAVRLFEKLAKQVPADMWPIIKVEMRLADLKADQEFYGMRVDIPKYIKNAANCNYVLDMLLSTFRRMTHEDGNISSPEVLGTLLYDKMGCKVLMRTNTGRRSTSSKAIDKLASLPAEVPHNITEDMVDMYGRVVIKAEKLAKSKYPALVVLSKYREYAKRKTAFYARFERTVRVGRIHFWINQNGASSGRQSSPMHQLPPELKDVILSDSEIKDMWGPDYSQIELRMIAYLADEPDLKEMCKIPTNDIHRVCASLITGKEMWEITKEERSIKKRVNFGVVYEISEYGLAGQLYGPGYTKEQLAFCREQLDAFYKRFKRINMYLKKNADLVMRRGYMRTALNRKKFFTEIFNPDITNRKRASLLRQSNNMPVQGTAADLMKIAEINMDQWIIDRGWNKPDADGFPKVRVMLSIHDEALISANKDIPYEEIMDMIKTCMQIDLEGAPPFFVEPARMLNWGGHSDDSLAVPVDYRDELIDNYHKTHKSVFKHSIYKVSLPLDKKEELNNDTGYLQDKVKKYLPFATFEKVKGDYTDELSEASKKTALKLYIESGFELYTDDNYKEKLNAYREKVLKNYMMGLIRQYGPNSEDVGNHVRHPSLTHQLLSRFSKELKGKDLTHVEQILYATKLYMEEAESGTAKEEIEDEQEIAVMDKDLFIDQTNNLYEFDKDGNIIYEEDEEEDEDYISDEDADYILYRTEGKIYKAWKTANTILLDVQDMSYEQIDKVLAYAFRNNDPNGFYKVYILANGNMIDARFRVEDMDIDDMSDYIVRLEKEE